MYNMADPVTISEEKINFNVNDDVNALCWLPQSGTDLLAATIDNLLFCDIRASWKTENYI